MEDAKSVWSEKEIIVDSSAEFCVDSSACIMVGCDCVSECFFWCWIEAVLCVSMVV